MVTRYKVVKIMNKTGNKRTLDSGLTREDAIKMVNSYPDSQTSMVVFYAM